MWSFIWINQKGNIIISRDRYGIKPLYYHIWQNGIIFSSEIKAILEYRGKKFSPNIDQIQLFNYGLSGSESNYTWFKNIFRVSPGSIITLHEGKIKILELKKVLTKS